MAKSIRDDKGIVACKDFHSMYADAADNFDSLCRGIALRRADEKSRTGIFKIISVAYDSLRLRVLNRDFHAACQIRCAFPYHDTPEDVLYKMAYPSQNLK